jgi:MOSC domain-containing protein YiiM
MRTNSSMMENGPLNKLMNQFPNEGKVVWIGIRPARRVKMKEVNSVQINIGTGLDGDRYSGKPGSKRQVTLIQDEHITTVAKLMKQNEIDPGLFRRNIVIKGINLLALKDSKFTIGNSQFEMTGLCHPCSRMEENLGPGGYNAMRGHGGITAKVLQEGIIKIGDSLKVL